MSFNPEIYPVPPSLLLSLDSARLIGNVVELERVVELSVADLNTMLGSPSGLLIGGFLVVLVLAKRPVFGSLIRPLPLFPGIGFSAVYIRLADDAHNLIDDGR